MVRDSHQGRSGRRRKATFAAGATATLGSLLAAVALAAEGDLTFVETRKNGVDGAEALDGANALAASPDGAHLYVGASVDDAVAVYERNAGTGALDFVEAQVDGAGGVDGLDNPAGLAISPDGKHVYATAFNDDAVTGFARDPATGELSVIDFEGADGENDLDSPIGITVSPDGKSVYVASQTSDALTTFDRDPVTGQIDLVESDVDGVGGADGLDGARGVAVAPDGEHVYTAAIGDDAVATFSRNESTGALQFVEVDRDQVGGVDSLLVARDVTVSPDGGHVYAVAAGDDALTAFSRNANTGRLSLIEAERDGAGGVDGLNGATSVVTSHDGKHVYTAASVDGSVAGFSRNPSSGAVTFVEAEKDGVGGVNELDGAFAVDATADGTGVYGAALFDDAVTAFAREPDRTAPDTTIDDGPGGEVADPTPAFEFSSDDAAFTARFECRLDGGAFATCASPETIGPLEPGPHTFRVRAVDTAGNADATPAISSFEVIGADVDGSATAKRTQKQKGKRVRVKVVVEAEEDLTARLGGRIEAGKSSFKLAPVVGDVAAGRSKTLKLKPAKRKQSRKIMRTLKRGDKAKARITARLSDETGNRDSVRLAVKLR